MARGARETAQVRRTAYFRWVTRLPGMTTGSSNRCGARARPAKSGIPCYSSTGARLMITSSIRPGSSAWAAMLAPAMAVLVPGDLPGGDPAPHAWRR